MKKTTKLIILALSIIMLLAGCSGSGEEATKLSFKNAEKYEDLQLLDGKTVAINGYLATSSPADGSFIFLMNLPYQSCPFCVPNTSQLSNTIEVYPKKNDSFSYTSSAVKVVGTLVVADEGTPFTDEYGYEFSFKIIDAEYKILKDSDIQFDVMLWNKIANSDIINDIYDMLDYIYFLSHWPEYSVDSYTDKDGNLVPGYYLWASDVTYLLEDDNGQFHYGYKDGYFDALISKINSIDSENLKDLVNVVTKAREFSKEALLEFTNKNYTYENKYLEEFNTTDDVYSLNNAKVLNEKYYEVYDLFSVWFTSWEM